MSVEEVVGEAKAVNEEGRSLPPAQRSDGVTLLAGYHFMLAGILLLGTVVLMIPTMITAIVGITSDPEALIGTLILAILAGVCMILCLLMVVVGYGLWTQRQWGRAAALALAFVSLIAFPIGTVIGALTLWYLLKPEIGPQFS